jgi:hypothetical protein
VIRKQLVAVLKLSEALFKRRGRIYNVATPQNRAPFLSAVGRIGVATLQNRCAPLFKGGWGDLQRL